MSVPEKDTHKLQLEKIAGAKVSNCPGISGSIRTYSRALSNDVHRGHVFGTARQRSARSQMG